MLATWADGIPDWFVYAILLVPVLLLGSAFFGLFLMLKKKPIVMMEFEVVVDAAVDAGEDAHVIFTIERGVNFTLTDESSLGGKPIKKWLSQPRALDEDGKPRHDIFNVILVNKADMEFFEDDDRVILLAAESEA